jgi:hypothetical protein
MNGNPQNSSVAMPLLSLVSAVFAQSHNPNFGQYLADLQQQDRQDSRIAEEFKRM